MPQPGILAVIYANMSAALTLTEDEVVDLCTQSGPSTNFCVHPAIKPVYFIKYGGNHTMGEVWTQEYVYDGTTDVPGGPRVPKVYHAFERGGRTYMVMEFINAPTVAEFLAEYPSKMESVHTSIASGLSWLLYLPLPQEMCLGPVGGGLAVHKFFGNHNDRAPLNFAHVLALQRYTNEVRTDDISYLTTATIITTEQHPHQALWRIFGRGPKETVDFESENRCFYHSDIREPNFLINSEIQELTFVDFQHVGILTTSFASYGLLCGDTSAAI